MEKNSAVKIAQWTLHNFKEQKEKNKSLAESKRSGVHCQSHLHMQTAATEEENKHLIRTVVENHYI